MRRRLIENISLPIKPTEESVAADICIVENNTLEKYIVDGTTYSTDLFPLDKYTPIGIVVVPASHTDDGTARIMSLVLMDNNKPDNGANEDIDESDIFNITKLLIPFGGNWKINKLLQYSAIINEDYLNNEFLPIQTIISWDNNSFNNISTDFIDSSIKEYTINPYDVKTHYVNAGLTHYKASPSPYLNDGSKNPLYSQVHDNGSGIGNIVENMNGKENTANILSLDNSYSTDWKTSSIIQNIGDNQYIHPAAQCCWRYHTVGTNQGDWYLPSAGEIGYIAARLNKIKNIYNFLKKINLFHVNLPSNYMIPNMTSDERNNTGVISFSPSTHGQFYSYDKEQGMYVYAFCKV